MMKGFNLPLRSQKGTTLIETIVALALTATIIGAILALVVSGLNATTSGKSRTVATNLAEEALDSVRTVRDTAGWSSFYSTYALGPGTSFYLDSAGTLHTAATPLCHTAASGAPEFIAPSYTRTITFTNEPTSGNQRVLVDICVAWNDRGTPQKVELNSYLADWN
jgi:type II secretory pathway pseudopilin PulG